jgi:hypothetical protein
MNISAQVVFMAKRILRELIVLGRVISAGFSGVQKQVETVAKEQKSQNEREQAQSIVRPEIKILPAINTEKEAREARNEKRDRWKLRIEAATFMAVLAYAFINYHMLRQMSREADAARDMITEMRSEQRPYMWVMFEEPQLKENTPIYWNVHVVNYGRSPAIRVRTCTVIMWGPNSIETKGPEYISETCRGKPEIAITISPPGYQTIAVNATPKLFTSQEIKGIDSGTIHLSIAGEIKYRDTFGHCYKTTFCSVWTESTVRPCATQNELQDIRNCPNLDLGIPIDSW